MDFLLIATPFETQKSNNQNANCRPWWEDSHRKERALDHHSQQEIQCHADNSRVSRLSLPSCEWCAKSQIHQCHSLHQLSFFAISTCNWSSKFMGVHGISCDFMIHFSLLCLRMTAFAVSSYTTKWPNRNPPRSRELSRAPHWASNPTCELLERRVSKVPRRGNRWNDAKQSPNGGDWLKIFGLPHGWDSEGHKVGLAQLCLEGQRNRFLFFWKMTKKTKRQRKNCDINTGGGKSVIKCDKMEQAYSSPAGLQILQVELPACGQSCWPPKSRTRWPDWAGVIFFCNHGHHKGGIDLCFGAHQNLSIAKSADLKKESEWIHKGTHQFGKEPICNSTLCISLLFLNQSWLSTTSDPLSIRKTIRWFTIFDTRWFSWTAGDQTYPAW